MSKHEIYITTEIAPDGEKFNYDTWQWEAVESPTSQNHFVRVLADVQDGDEIHLYINSLGGSVKEALGIYNALKRAPAKVFAHIDGFAASAASIIAMAADEVIMPRNTCMMIHNAAWWTYGNPAELRKSADDLEVINKSAIESYMMKAGNKLDAVTLQRFLDAETWLTAAECLEYGLADRVDEAGASTDPMQFYRAAAAAYVHYPAAKITAEMAAKLSAKRPEPAQKVVPNSGTDEHENQPEAAVNHGMVYDLLKNMLLEEK